MNNEIYELLKSACADFYEDLTQEEQKALYDLSDLDTTIAINIANIIVKAREFEFLKVLKRK